LVYYLSNSIIIYFLKKDNEASKFSEAQIMSFIPFLNINN